MAQASGPVSLDVRTTLQLSLSLVRSEWRWLALFVAILGIAPSAGSSLIPHGAYRPGGHDLRALALYACEAAAFSMIGYFWPLTVMAMSLEHSVGRAPSKALLVALSSALTLMPLWLLTHLNDFFRLWLRWDHWTPTGPHRGERFASLLLSASLTAALINVIVLVSVGLINAVVIAERLDFARSLSRTWRLMRGNRWKVIALCLLIQSAAYVPTFAWTIWRAALTKNQATTAVAFGDWATFVLDCCTDALWAVVVAAAYLEIRRVREGVAVGDVAPIFA